MTRESRPVYSTADGRLCADCAKPVNACICDQLAAQAIVGDGIVRVSRESKGRKGKGVTLISGLPLKEAELKALAKRLKQQCSTGGTIKAGLVEIQGDHRDKLLELLRAEGFEAKKAGG